VVVNLLGGAFRVHDVHVEPVEGQLSEQVLGAVLGLQKQQHRRPDAFLDQLPYRQHFAFLPTHENELLVDGGRAGVLDADGEGHGVAQKTRREFAHRGPYRGAEQGTLQAGRRGGSSTGAAFAAFATFTGAGPGAGAGGGRAFGQDLVDLEQKRRRGGPVVVVVVVVASALAVVPTLSLPPPAPACLQLEQFICETN